MNRTHPERGTPPRAGAPEVNSTPQPRFTVPERSSVTGEPPRVGQGLDPQYPDVSWVSQRNMGGGHVPEDLQWKTNPYQRREDPLLMQAAAPESEPVDEDPPPSEIPEGPVSPV